MTIWFNPAVCYEYTTGKVVVGFGGLFWGFGGFFGWFVGGGFGVDFFGGSSICW